MSTDFFGRRCADINKQKYLAELFRLLGFMAAKDRQTVIEKYGAMFDEAEDETALIAELGTPTKLAISLAGDYIPSPADEESVFPDRQGEAEAEDLTEPEELPETAEPEELPAQAEDVPPAQLEEMIPAQLDEESPEQAEETGPVFEGSDSISPEMLREISRHIAEADGEAPIEEAPAEEEEAEAPAEEDEAPAAEEAPEEPAALEATTFRRRAKPVALTFYILLSLVIGLPIAVVLILIGVPFLAAGAGVIVAASYAAISLIAALHMFSDILLVFGTGLAAAAIGLVIAWLGLWISIGLGRLWIGRVILRQGSRLCFRQEAVQQ